MTGWCSRPVTQNLFSLFFGFLGVHVAGCAGLPGKKAFGMKLLGIVMGDGMGNNSND